MCILKECLNVPKINKTGADTLKVDQIRDSDSDEENSAEQLLDIVDRIVFQPEGHPKQALIEGQIWPPSFEAPLLRSAKQFVARPSDVFVCTYPKCGTTWIQHICSLLLHDDKSQSQHQQKPLSLASPMIERMGAKFCEDLEHPRLLKTHLRRTQFPMSPKAKYIFAARNPKDCLVSYFHHNRNFKIYEWHEGNFDTFFELFISGQLGFGDYFEHLLSWLPYLKDHNVLFLKYEDMLDDLEGNVRKIGSFLGGEAEMMVCEHLDKVVDASRMDAMKQNQDRFFPASALHEQKFIRKGCTRDWKNYMSREQSDQMDEMFRAKLSGTVAEGWWEDEMRWDNPEAEDTEGENPEAEDAETEGAEAEDTEAEDTAGEEGKPVIEHEEDQSSGYSSDDSTR